MKIAKAHYIYLAIGYDASKACNKLALLYPLLRMQFYIGVRTGQLPDDGYKTSSRNKQWKYIAKVPLAIYSLREEANEDEVYLLKYLKERHLWNMLANKAIGKTPCTLDLPCSSGENHWNFGKQVSANTRAKISFALLGSKNYNFGRENSLETRQRKSKSAKNKIKSCSHIASMKKSRLINTNTRLTKYGAIAIEHKKHGAILLAGPQCMLDFCEQAYIRLGDLEGVFKGRNRSVKGWRLLEHAD